MILENKAAHSTQTAKGPDQMLSTNNLVFFIVHALLRLRRLAGALHFLDVLFSPPIQLSVVASPEEWSDASTDMATASSGCHWSLAFLPSRR
jgi:hypothetical protein